MAQPSQIVFAEEKLPRFAEWMSRGSPTEPSEVKSESQSQIVCRVRREGAVPSNRCGQKTLENEERGRRDALHSLALPTPKTTFGSTKPNLPKSRVLKPGLDSPGRDGWITFCEDPGPHFSLNQAVLPDVRPPVNSSGSGRAMRRPFGSTKPKITSFPSKEGLLARKSGPDVAVAGSDPADWADWAAKSQNQAKSDVKERQDVLMTGPTGLNSVGLSDAGCGLRWNV